MRCLPVFRSCGTVFDLAGKQALRAQLTDRMAKPDFWDNQEKAQQTIQELKQVNGLLTPYEGLEKEAGDLRALGELCEEDASLSPELDSTLDALEKRLGEFELRALMAGAHDGSNAYLRIQAGTGGTEA